MPRKFPTLVAQPKTLLVLAALASLLLPDGAGARPARTPPPPADPWESAAFAADPGAIARAAAKVQGEADVVVLLMEVSYTFDL